MPPLPADVLAGMQEVIEKRRATIPADYSQADAGGHRGGDAPRAPRP